MRSTSSSTTMHRRCVSAVEFRLVASFAASAPSTETKIDDLKRRYCTKYLRILPF